MAENVQHVLEQLKYLNAGDRALIARCLISSLEGLTEEGVDPAWAKLAEKRYEELVSTKVGPVTWEEIKGKVKGSSELR